MKLSFAVACSVGAAVLAPMWVIALTQDRWKSPDIEEMRHFRARELSDDELRKFRAEAELQATKINEQRYREKKEAERAAWLDVSKKCDDPAYVARQPGGVCNRLPAMLAGTSVEYRAVSADELFRQMVLGGCEFLRSVHEAKKYRCLPSD